ncbi:hypothetical protein BDK51DRAFT_51389 [Blyttiomyces helicus]|uniref:SH3 domain-containing protein n=1 Tax=Blyttiomyces helicus TaxID=388810 RepID=A0A4P9VXE7_9FUNG|nr:hypothetical protein BDK51DRAFT_51389 [Blyttiomyces helicus]|eukprot:RKO84384.1 hypothetical protein BDK51DRAFT_51389 [Blyttiomyces helicus]
MANQCNQTYSVVNGDLDGSYMSVNDLPINNISEDQCWQQCVESCSAGKQCFWYKYATKPGMPTQCYLQTVQLQTSSSLYVRATNLTIPGASFPLDAIPNNRLLNNISTTTPPDQCQSVCDQQPLTSCVFASWTDTTCELIEMWPTGISSNVRTGFAPFFSLGPVPSTPSNTSPATSVPPQSSLTPTFPTSTSVILTQLPGSPTLVVGPLPPSTSTSLPSTSTSLPSTSTSLPSTSSTSSSGTSTGGIAVGCAIGGVLIAVLAMYLFYRFRKNKRGHTAIPPSTLPDNPLSTVDIPPSDPPQDAFVPPPAYGAVPRNPAAPFVIINAHRALPHEFANSETAAASLEAHAPGAIAIARAVHVPKEKDELALEVGDQVIVDDVFRDGWAKGRLTKDGREGVFPYGAVVHRA